MKSELRSTGIQRIESRQAFVKQFINEAFESERPDLSSTPDYAIAKLIQGWVNGNVHFSTVTPPPTPPALVDRTDSDPHSFDIYCVVPTLGTGTGWKQITEIYVLDEPFNQ